MALLLIYLEWSAPKIYQRYRRRFGIESPYRPLNHLRARFLFLGLALFLRNIWVMLR